MSKLVAVEMPMVGEVPDLNCTPFTDTYGVPVPVVVSEMVPEATELVISAAALVSVKAVADATVAPPVSVARPVTASVLLSVAAPVTASVLLRVEARDTASVPVTETPVVARVSKLVAPVMPIVLVVLN